MQNDKGKVREYKVLLGAISVFAGLFSFYFIAESSYGIFRGIFFGFLVSLLYPVFAALTVKSIFALFKFALIWDKNYRWINEYQILVGAFWPLAMPISLAISLYALIINRLFREHWNYSSSYWNMEDEDRWAKRGMRALGDKYIIPKEWRKMHCKDIWYSGISQLCCLSDQYITTWDYPIPPHPSHHFKYFLES